MERTKMLRFKDGKGKLHKIGYYFEQKWTKIFLDGDEIISNNDDSKFIDFVESSINSSRTYYLAPDKNAPKVILVEL